MGLDFSNADLSFFLGKLICRNSFHVNIERLHCARFLRRIDFVFFVSLLHGNRYRPT